MFTYVVQAGFDRRGAAAEVGEDSDGDSSVVDQGTRAGRAVVTSNQYRLQPGAHVRVVTPTQAALRPPARRRRRGAGVMSISDTLHPAADRHLAADGGDPARRRRRLSAAAGRAAAAGRLSDHPGQRATLPGASPGDHGLVGRDAARVPVRADPGRVAADLARACSGSTPDHACSSISNRNIDAAAQDIQSAIDAAGGQLPKNLPSPPSYRKVNPADSPILILVGALGRAAADDGRRLRREHPRPADLADSRASRRSSLGGQQKPAVRVQVDPAKIAALGIQLEDVAQRHPAGDGRRRPRARSTVRRTASRSTTTTSC